MYAQLGSISSGTLRTEDLLETFADELECLVRQHGWLYDDDSGVKKLMRDATEADPETEDAASIVDDLINALNEYAPPYATFGAHEGDGADFGFWPVMDTLDEDCRYGDVLKIDAGDEIPGDFDGEYVVAVTDHGNVTLYERNDERLRGESAWIEVWSTV